MSIRRRLMLFALWALPAGPLITRLSRAEEPRYDVVDLGTLPGGRGTEPRAIK